MSIAFVANIQKYIKNMNIMVSTTTYDQVGIFAEALWIKLMYKNHCYASGNRIFNISDTDAAQQLIDHIKENPQIKIRSYFDLDTKNIDEITNQAILSDKLNLWHLFDAYNRLSAQQQKIIINDLLPKPNTFILTTGYVRPFDSIYYA